MALTIHTGIEKGVYFDNTHSFDDFNLIFQSESIEPATPKTTYEDLDGMDGSKDLTESLGEVKFKNRTGKLTFFVQTEDDFEDKKMEVSNAINGQVFKITLEKAPDYYYYGRCTVSEYKSSKTTGQIIIEVNVEPYRLKQEVTEQQFDLSSTATSITLTNDRKSVCPSIATTGETTVTFGDNTYTMEAGTYKFLSLRLVQGDNALTVKGTGTVTFKYQEGAL